MEINTHAIAFRCYTHRFASLTRIFLKQLLYRLFALLPIAASMLSPERFAFRYAVILTGLLYIVLVFPQRFSAALSLTKLVRQQGGRTLHKSPYSARLIASFIRLGTGALWGVPFAALAYRTYQYIFVFAGTKFSKDFTALGALFLHGDDSAMQMMLGSGIYFGILAFAFVVFIYGWWRGVPYDFQMVGDVSAQNARRIARRVRKRCRWKLIKNAAVHTLLCLPAIVVPLMIPYLKLRPLLGGQAMEDIQLIYVYLSAGMVSDGTLIFAFVVFLILYLPFLPYRKLRNAAVVVNCYAKKR